jgi:uncharacterized coiled-coil protein SlyX
MIDTIKNLVEQETNIEDISTRVRKQQLVDARVIYTVLALRHTKYSYERIGGKINRDHSTIVHHQRIYSQWRQQPEMFTAHLRTLQKLDDVITGKEKIVKVDRKTIDKLTTKNALLKKENKELLSTIDRLQDKIKELEKYAPIW